MEAGSGAAGSNEVSVSNQESVCKTSNHESPKGEAREHSLKFLKKSVSEKKRRQRKAPARKR